MAFIVMSAESAQHPVLNLRNTLEMIDTIESQGYAYKVGTGVYKGKGETCVQFFFHEDRLHEALLMASDLLDRYKQECILLVEDNGEASLLYANSAATPSGQWAETDRLAVQDGDAHTEIDGRYYVLTQ